MKNIIDIHSHILPGVDDGCKEKTEAIQMLKMYEDQNVESVICTPHFGPCAKPKADVEGTFEWLKSTSNSVNLYLGNEILMTRHTLLDVRRGIARTLDKTKWILIEFEDWLYASTAEEIVEGAKWLAASEYKVILAHPERYENIQFNPGLCKEITKSGVKLQINAYDVYENSNPLAVKTTQYLLNNKLVSFIGSDAHGAKRRSPALSAGVQWIYDHCPEEYADAIVHDNAAKIIKEGEA